MNEKLTIPKEISPEYGKEYAFLRTEGLKHIESLSHKLWTDYNVHDPGVTILEMLSYAITDLGYRISMPVQDILAKPKDNLQEMHRQFLSAIHSLPSAPVSADDYRQLFVRVDGVRNGWIMPAEQTIVAKYRNLATEGHPELHYKAPGEVVNPKKAHEFILGGINRILLDFDESVLLSPEEYSLDEGARELLMAKRKFDIRQKVLEVFSRYRNLCEDVETVTEVPLEGIVICGDINIEPNADPEQVWAEIVFNINQYLSPDIPFYNLLEMQEMGIPTDEIFEGPVFSLNDDYPSKTPGNPFSKKGFIRKDDLRKSELRSEARLSDIIHVIMETKGVKLVKEISFALCGCDEKDKAKVLKAVAADKWNLCITPGHKPVLCLDNSVLNMWKDVMPIELKMSEAFTRLNQLMVHRNASMRQKVTADLPMPEGTFRDIGDYQTIQNHFPETYGIGRAGLPESAPVARKAQAKQLKAYLLFFEQVLADYFAQLNHVSVLLSSDISIAKTYFANVVNGIKEDASIVDDVEKWKENVGKIYSEQGLDPYINRKNKFLDHLLARFAEHFNEYVFLMHRLYASDADKAIIRQKADFLDDYYNMSAVRGSGFDYYNPLNDKDLLVNIPGMEKRISRLLGFNHYRRLPLAKLAYNIVETSKITLLINGVSKEVQQYGWTLSMSGTIIFESLNRTFLKKADAFEEMGLASMLGCEKENYRLLISANQKKVSFRLIDTKGNELASHPKQYNVVPEGTGDEQYINALNKIEEIRQYLFGDFRLEGMYVVEHLLLRPDADIPESKHKLFFPVCIEPGGEYCRPLDPYSFRVTIVLPGYSMRFRNKYFRKFAEKLIRMETPAHILPRICFINEEFMKKFETLYAKWLKERRESDNPLKQCSDNTLKNLINVIEEMYTIYEEGSLTDCDDDTMEKNPIILGSTQLGSLESDSKPG